jgi:hypothetical protein
LRRRSRRGTGPRIKMSPASLDEPQGSNGDVTSNFPLPRRGQHVGDPQKHGACIESLGVGRQHGLHRGPRCIADGLADDVVRQAVLVRPIKVPSPSPPEHAQDPRRVVDAVAHKRSMCKSTRELKASNGTQNVNLICASAVMQVTWGVDGFFFSPAVQCSERPS